MIFGMESDELTDFRNRIATVFKMLDRNVYSDGIHKADRRLTEIPLEQMIQGGFAYTAFPCQAYDSRGITYSRSRSSARHSV